MTDVPEVSTWRKSSTDLKCLVLLQISSYVIYVVVLSYWTPPAAQVNDSRVDDDIIGMTDDTRRGFKEQETFNDLHSSFTQYDV